MDELSRILLRLQAGDRNAWDPLVRGQAPRLLGIAWSIVRDRDMAEDILQEVFLRLARGDLARIRPGSAGAYLARMTARAAIDALRRDESRHRREEELAMTPRPQEMGPLEQAIHSEERLQLRQAFCALPPETRAALWLHVVEGVGIREAASSLGLPRSTLADRLRLALERLRKALDPRTIPAVAPLPWPRLLRDLAPPEPSPDRVARLLELGEAIAPSGSAAAGAWLGGLIGKKAMLAGPLALLLLAGGSVVLWKTFAERKREGVTAGPRSGGVAGRGSREVAAAPSGGQGGIGPLSTEPSPPAEAGGAAVQPSSGTKRVVIELRDACSGERIDPAKVRLDFGVEEVKVDASRPDLVLSPSGGASYIPLRGVAAEGYFEKETSALSVDREGPVVIRLERVLGISGAVLDGRTRLPLESAEVRLVRSLPGSSEDEQVLSVTRTDSLGAFSIGGLRNKETRERWDLVVAAEEHALHKEVITFPSCEPLKDRLVLLEEGFRLSGTVVTDPPERIAGVEGFEVFCRWDYERKRSSRALDFRSLRPLQADTGYRIPFTFDHLPPGPYLVNAWALKDKGLTADNYTAVIEVGKERETVITDPIVLRQGRTIGGIILSEDGLPVRGVAYLLRGQRALPSADAGADGRFEIHGLRPGVSYQLQIGTVGGGSRTFEVEKDFDQYWMLPPEGSKRVRLFVELDGVLDRSPDPGYRYLLFDREGTRRPRHHCCFLSGQELRLPAYQFMVIDAFERSAPAIIRCEDLAPGENTIALEPGAILEGTVVDAEGNPVHGATVVANLEGVPSRWDTTATTGQGGRFRLGGLPRDSEEVIVYPRSEDGRRSGDRVRRPNYAERLVLVLR